MEKNAEQQQEQQDILKSFRSASSLSSRLKTLEKLRIFQSRNFWNSRNFRNITLEKQTFDLPK